MGESQGNLEVGNHSRNPDMEAIPGNGYDKAAPVNSWCGHDMEEDA